MRNVFFKTVGYGQRAWGNANIDRVTLSCCFLAKRPANAGNGFSFDLALTYKNLNILKSMGYWLTICSAESEQILFGSEKVQHVFC